MKGNILIRMLIMLGVYIGLRFYGGEVGAKVLYPIQLLVTFLHEFGHALGALITGGEVLKIHIDPNKSGFTQTMGGSRSIILMGGYIGSAIFGNLLFFIGARAKPLVKPLLGLLALSMVGTGIFWFNSAFTTAFLLGFAAFLLIILFKTNFGREILMFLGLASVLYIIQDFNVGPSSDLEKYAEIMKVMPVSFWMYFWLAIALSLFAINIWVIFKTMKREKDDFVDDDFLDMNATT